MTAQVIGRKVGAAQTSDGLVVQNLPAAYLWDKTSRNEDIGVASLLQPGQALMRALQKTNTASKANSI